MSDYGSSSAVDDFDYFNLRLDAIPEKNQYWVPLIPTVEKKAPQASKGLDIKGNILTPPTQKEREDGAEYIRITPIEARKRVQHDLCYGIYAVHGGLCFIDIDTHKGNLKITDDQLSELIKSFGTFVVKTRDGGYHFYFINDTETPNGLIYVNGINSGELRTNWEYVIGPGSYYAKSDDAVKGATGRYTIFKNQAIQRYSKITLPSWMIITESKEINEDTPVIRPTKKDLYENEFGWSLQRIIERDTKLFTLLNESVVKGIADDRSGTDAAIVGKLHWYRFSHSDIAGILQYYRPYEKTNRDSYINRTIANCAIGTQMDPPKIKVVDVKPTPIVEEKEPQPTQDKPKRRRFKEPVIVKTNDIDSFLMSFIGSLVSKGFTPDQVVQKIKNKIDKGEIEGNLAEPFWFATKIPGKIKYCIDKKNEADQQLHNGLPDCIKTDEIVDAAFLERISRFRLDGVGNAERFLAYYEKDLRYNQDTEMWHVWTGQTWEPKHESEIQVLAITVARNIYREITHLVDDTERSNHAKWAIDSNDRGRISGMVTLSRGFVGIKQNDFDKFPYKLNMKNGVFDLKTLQFEEGGIKEEFHSRQTNVVYDEDATCPKWEEHINLILQNNKDMIETLQISLGYSLLGQHAEYLFVPFGTGRNGKGITLQVIRGILGTYAGAVDVKTITTSSFDKGIREDLANLRGLRFVYAEEPDRNAKLDTASIKKWTGGGEIKACYKYGHEFTYEPTFALWLNTNHMPKINETTTAIKERLRMFPFNYTIPKEDRVDPIELVKYFIETEGPGIFNWLIEGLWKYQQTNKIPFCNIVITASDRAILENDKLERCIHDIAVLDQFNHVTKKEWFIAVGNWCSENEEEGYRSPRELTFAMTEKGFDGTQRTNTNRIWKGIRFKSKEELASDQQSLLKSDTVTQSDVKT